MLMTLGSLQYACRGPLRCAQETATV